MIVANAQPAARRLLDMARDIAREADPDFQSMQRLQARLDRAEAMARQRLQEARRGPSEPEHVQDTRNRAEVALRASRRATGAERQAEARLDQLREAAPRGLMAWLTGRTAQHRQELEQAREAERQATAERKRLEEAARIAEAVQRAAERRWGEQRAEIEQHQTREAEAAQEALQWVADARNALRADPALARDERALQEAVERLQEDRRQQELEERRQADRPEPDGGYHFGPR